MADPTYTVQRSILVEAPPDRVDDELMDFHRWPAWSPWEGIDPDMRRSYSGPEQGPGSVYEWSGNRKAGSGRMEILEVVPASKVAVDLRFLKPFKSHSTTVFTLGEQGNDLTEVTWTMTGPRTLAVRAMGVFTSMDKLIGGDFEKGLSRLKDVVERSPS